MKEDRQMIMITHLSQLLNFVTGLGGLIVPLLLWTTQKEKVYEMDEHGKSVINFQLSLFVYFLLSVAMAFLSLRFGVLIMIAIGVFSLIFPIINAIRVNNGETPNYPLSIEFIK